MSTQAPSNDPDTDRFGKVGRTSERKRAAMVLAIIAAVAVVLVAVMVLVLGSSGDDKATPPAPTFTGPAVTVTGGQSHSSSAPASHSRSGSTSASSSATRTKARTGPVSCPTSAPCSLPDDVGNAVQALNDYRTAHGRQAVTGHVTRAARSCAVSSGDTCHSDFFWEPVGRSGKQVITKIADSGSKGTSWLLDRSMKSVAVGWAYIPSSKSYECALIAEH